MNAGAYYSEMKLTKVFVGVANYTILKEHLMPGPKSNIKINKTCPNCKQEVDPLICRISAGNRLVKDGEKAMCCPSCGWFTAYKHSMQKAIMAWNSGVPAKGWTLGFDVGITGLTPRKT